VAGVAIALSEYAEQERAMTKHGMMGLVVMALAVLQIGAGLARPGHDAPARARWHVAHAVVGSVAVALGLLQCVFGSMLLHDREGEPPLPYILPALASAALAIALTVFGGCSRQIRSEQDALKAVALAKAQAHIDTLNPAHVKGAKQEQL